MQLTKEELVKFKAWRNQGRKFWAQILLWSVWGGSSLVIFSLLGSLIPEEAMSRWMNYRLLSVWFFILAGMVFGITSTISSSKNGKVRDRKDLKVKPKSEAQKRNPETKKSG